MSLLALVVDDSSSARSQRKSLLEASQSFSVILAEDEHAAQREFGASPGISIAFVDVNLHPEKLNDRSGVALARRLREAHPGLPVVGYSAAFDDGDLTPDECAAFTVRIMRGTSTADVMLNNLENWRDKAKEFSDRRIRQSKERLQDLRVKYPNSPRDFTMLRSLSPQASISGLVADSTNTESSLRQLGYEMRIIDTDGLRPNTLGELVPVSRPICIWTRSSLDHHTAEIYGFPELYGIGDSQEEAIEALLVLMDGFRRDLSEPTANGDSARVKLLADYLERTLAPNFR